MTPDQPISLGVAIIGSILCLVLPRRYALVPLALSICLYPSTLIMPPKALSLTPQRVIAVVLILRCILQESIRSQFRWRLVDTAAAAYFLLLLASQVLTTPVGPAINNRAGFFLSALLPFWCVRFLVVDRASLHALLKGWLLAAVPLAMLGMYQMQTGDSPYFRIMQYGILWKQAPNTKWDMRPLLGQMYFRASAPFLQFIMFGWFFALLLSLTTNLYWEKRRLWPWIVAWCFLPVGVVSSLSSGPRLFSAMSLFLLALFPWRRFWRIGFGTAGAFYLAILLFANRSPMEFAAQLGMDPVSSWYRVNLVKFTLHGGAMRSHWLTGWGDIPAAFGYYHDLCIHWVWLLVVHGVMGWIGFYGLMAACAWSLWKAREVADDVADQWLLWSLLSTLLATLVGMLVVALFSEMYFIYHMFLALIANSNQVVRADGQTRQVDLLVRSGGRPVLLRYTLRPGQQLALVRPAGGGVPAGA